jgi:hypothetical protein
LNTGPKFCREKEVSNKLPFYAACNTKKIANLIYTPSTTKLEEEEIVDATGKDGNASMPEEVKRPNPWGKMMMMISFTPQQKIETSQNFVLFVQSDI